MTVTSTKYFTDWYLGNGVNRDWGFDFTILSQDDVIVQVRDGTDDTSIVEHTTDLAFYPTEDLSSGSVKFPVVASPLAIGKQVRLVRQVAYTQNERIGKEGKFLPKTHENAFDKVTIMAQQVERNLDRAIKVQIGGDSLEVVSSLADGEVLMKQGGFLVSGPTAASITSAQGYAEAAETAQLAAVAARDKAEAWATEVEDTPVETGPNRYSALHWANKSADETAATAALKADVQALRDEVDTILATGRVPVGTIIYFASTTAPDGYLECDGAVITALYPDLRALLIAAGSPFGVSGADPKLPDLRGEFMRGWDHGRGIDAARTFGSSQLDAFQGHKQRLGAAESGVNSSAGGTMVFRSTGTTDTTGPVTDGINGAPRTAAETRPRNIAMLPCIKAFGAVNPTGMADLAALLTAIATQVQAEAGDDNTTLMTPLRTKQFAVNYNKYKRIASVNSAGAIAFVHTDLGAYRRLLIDGVLASLSTAGYPVLQFSSDNGATWITTATYDYLYGYHVNGGTNGTTTAGATGVPFMAAANLLASSRYSAFKMDLKEFNKAQYTIHYTDYVVFNSAGTYVEGEIVGHQQSAVAMNAFRFTNTQTLVAIYELVGVPG